LVNVRTFVRLVELTSTLRKATLAGLNDDPFSPDTFSAAVNGVLGALVGTVSVAGKDATDPGVVVILIEQLLLAANAGLRQVDVG
jgi:hypothetical protein